MKNHIFIGLFALITLGCQKVDDTPFSLTLIHQANLYGAGEENIPSGNRVIEEEKDWEDLLAKIDNVNPESENFSETKIDFDNYMVVACFDKVQSSAGYSIAIDEAEATKKELIFNISKDNTGEILALVITQPYYIAKFPKTNKKITFKD